VTHPSAGALPQTRSQGMAAEEGCPLSRGWEKRIAAKTAAAGDRVVYIYCTACTSTWRRLPAMTCMRLSDQADAWDIHHPSRIINTMCTYPFGTVASFLKDSSRKAIGSHLGIRAHAVGMPIWLCIGSLLTVLRTQETQGDCFAAMHILSAVSAACVAQARRGLSWAASWRCCGRPPWGGTPSARAPAWPSASAAMAVRMLSAT
jgi:hypothetical protein